MNQQRPEQRKDRPAQQKDRPAQPKDWPAQPKDWNEEQAGRPSKHGLIFIAIALAAFFLFQQAEDQPDLAIIPFTASKQQGDEAAQNMGATAKNMGAAALGDVELIAAGLAPFIQDAFAYMGGMDGVLFEEGMHAIPTLTGSLNTKGAFQYCLRDDEKLEMVDCRRTTAFAGRSPAILRSLIASVADVLGRKLDQDARLRLDHFLGEKQGGSRQSQFLDQLLKAYGALEGVRAATTNRQPTSQPMTKGQLLGIAAQLQQVVGDHAEALFTLGALYEAAGEKAKSRAAYMKAVSVAPHKASDLPDWVLYFSQ